MSVRADKTPFWSLLAVALCAVGCQSVFPTPDKGLLEQLTPQAQLSSHQLRVLVNDFALRFNSRVEEGADRILAQTSDRTIRRNAILWKKNATSTAFRAASRTDSLAAYLDLWILNRQMAALFTSPEGNRLFGPYQAIAIETCRDLEPDLKSIYAAIGSDLPGLSTVNAAADSDLPVGEAFVTQFAADYPIRNLYLERKSLSARYVQAVGGPTRELYQVVGQLQENLTELQKLSIVYAEHVPKQSRWEAELLLLDATDIETIAQPLAQFSAMADSVARVTPIVTSVPQLIHQERHQLQQFVAQERLATMEQIDRMRDATMGDIERERVAVLDAVREERIAAGQQLDMGLTRALYAADEISRQRTDEIAGHGEALIDHAFGRVQEMLWLLIPIVAAIGLLAWWRRPRVAQPPGREGDRQTIPVDFGNATEPPRRSRAA
jgi:hypothetical protein